MTLRTLLFALSASLVLPATSNAAATDIPFGPTLEAAGWKTMTFRGLTPTNYKASGADQLDIDAQKSSSLIWRAVPKAAFDERSARWRWKADEAAPATDLAKKGGDDRAAAIYFAFAPESDRAKASAGDVDMRRMLVSGNGRILIYTFGGAGPIGASSPNPYLRGAGVTMIARPASAATGAWYPENVDLARDYERAFGATPGPLVAVAISSDSDDTGTRNRVVISNLKLGAD